MLTRHHPPHPPHHHHHYEKKHLVVDVALALVLVLALALVLVLRGVIWHHWTWVWTIPWSTRREGPLRGGGRTPSTEGRPKQQGERGGVL